jgi:hypothetical protein
METRNLSNTGARLCISPEPVIVNNSKTNQHQHNYIKNLIDKELIHLKYLTPDIKSGFPFLLLQTWNRGMFFYILLPLSQGNHHRDPDHDG